MHNTGFLLMLETSTFMRDDVAYTMGVFMTFADERRQPHPHLSRIDVDETTTVQFD